MNFRTWVILLTVMGFVFVNSFISPAPAVTILPDHVDWDQKPEQELTLQDAEQPAVRKVQPEKKEPFIYISLFQPHLLPEGEVTLGDIAGVETDTPSLTETIKGLVMGPSPKAGKELVIFPKRIEAALRQMGFQSGDFKITGPDRIVLSSPSQKVSLDQIEESIRLAFEARDLELPGTTTTTVHLMNAPNQVLLPPGEVEMKVTDLDRKGSGIRNVQVDFLVNGNRVETQSYPVKVQENRRAYVAARDLQRGEMLRDTDLVEDFVASSLITGNQDVITDPSQIVGGKLLRPIAAGKPVTTTDVEWTPLKRKGESINLLARYGSVEMTAKGVLVDDLFQIGQEVRVRKEKSRKEWLGRAVDETTVLLK